MREVTIVKTLYQFEELSDKAKEKAREWFRDGTLHDEWWDNVYDECADIAKILGIDLRTRKVTHRDKSVTYEPNIWFSGFSSQGDGACFEGFYSKSKNSVKRIKAERPTDETLNQIAQDLRDLQLKHSFALRAEVKHSGHYNHSGCTEINCDYDYNVFKREPSYEAYEELKRLLRNFMDWIYKQLEQEYDHQMSDEVVDETIIANEYEFNKSGKRDDA